MYKINFARYILSPI